MNPSQKVAYACALLWVAGFFGTSCARPGPVPSDLDAEPVDGGNSANVVAPQVGYLEERPDIVQSTSNVPNGSSGPGILVPIVSMIDGDTSKGKSITAGNNPLVALLPAPGAPLPGQDSKLPVIATLPIVPYDQPVKSEIRRSLSVSDETMDVAEDIVFRPLFRIRQNEAKNPYSTRNLRRNNRNNYRRYNVNGYYRIPYNYFNNNNNNNNRGYDDYD